MSDNYPVDGELRRQAARIEALEQAHAELAAKVDGNYATWKDQVTKSREVINSNFDEIRDRIGALESPAPAKGCWKCSYTGRILNTSIPGGPSNPCECQRPAPAPDPVCGEDCDGSCQKCEDRMFERIYGGGDELPACSRCGGTLIENNCISRECTAYVPEQTAQDKDRRSALIRLMNMLTLNQVNALGEDDMVLNFGKVGEIHIDEHLRAYGKPGANPKMIVPEKRITFVPTAEPEPAPLDPVLVDELEAFVRGWKKNFQFCELGYIDNARVDIVEQLIKAYRAYGRDGAR